MRTQFNCLALAIVLICPFTSAQWVQTSCPYPIVSSPFVAGPTPVVSGTNLFVASSGGVFLSTDYGTSWSAASTHELSHYLMALTISDTVLFAGTHGGGALLSTDNGTSWMATGAGLTDSIVFALYVSGTNLYAGTYRGGVFLSTNNGTSWAPVNTGLPTFDDPTKYISISCFAVSGINLFAGTFYDHGVFLSTDNGTGWTEASTGLPKTDVHHLAVSGTNLYAGTYNAGVFLSTNNGTSWTAASTGLPHDPYGPTPYLPVSAFAVNGTNLFTGNDAGVFVSTNSGTSWTAASSGLTKTRVLSLAVSGTYLFAVVDESGVWRRPLSEMVTSVESVSNGSPSEYSLHQNYPNPFNPTTTIAYTVGGFRNQESGFSLVYLAVYDLVGREVAVLVNERKAPGRYRVEFDASGLSSGIYFYRLEAGRFTETRKLVLLR